MDFLKNCKLIESKDGYDLIIYLEPGSTDIEFADELNKMEGGSNGLRQNIIDSFKENFPDKKINTVKLILGTVLVSSFILGLPAAAQAAGTTTGGTTQTQSAYSYNVNVSINGRVQTFQNKPLIFNNITYVPVSEFGKAIGASVWWNAASRTVGINQGSTSIAFVRGSAVARVNGVQKPMPVSIAIDGTTYAPLRFIAVSLGYKVTLNSTSKTVNVSRSTAQNKYSVAAGDYL